MDHENSVILAVDQVHKGFANQTRPVLNGVSLDLHKGQTLALTGESGCGKSTLLHLVASLDRPDAGEIRIKGRALSTLTDRDASALRRTTVALVFQQFNLVPSMTVGQNFSLHARLRGAEDAAWSDHIVDRLGLLPLWDRLPAHISGGQQQRVAIGRALAMRPEILLADEPTGNLDETASGAAMDVMLELVRDSGAALFLVTHSPDIAQRLDRQLRLSDGQIA